MHISPFIAVQQLFPKLLQPVKLGDAR